MARGMLFPAGLMVLIVVLVNEACSGNGECLNRFECLNPAPSSAVEDCEAPPESTINSGITSSNNEAPSTITSKITSSGEAAGSIKPQLEEIPAASVKLVMKAVHFDAHFQMLEVMQKQISTLINTMKEVHSAFNDHLQGIQFTDPVDRK